jgi:hypothetical protein
MVHIVEVGCIQGQNLKVLLQTLPAGLPKIKILVAQQNFLRSSN